MSFLCHFTLIFSLVNSQMSVCGCSVCHISILFDISPSSSPPVHKRCIIKKNGPYFLFIYADSTVLAVPVHLLFCSPTSSCSHWDDTMQNKEVSQKLRCCFCWHNAVLLATLTCSEIKYHLFRTFIKQNSHLLSISRNLDMICWWSRYALFCHVFISFYWG